MNARAVGRRLTLATLASLLGGTVTVNAIGATEAENAEELPDADVVMAEFDPQDFAEQASELPPDLVEAIERDLEVPPDRYLARAAAAKVAGDVVASLGDIVTTAWLDGQELNVAVEDRSDEAAAAATGATVHVGDALADAVEAARSQGRLAYPDRDEGRIVPVESEVVGESARSSQLATDQEERETGDLSGGFGYWTSDTLFVYECTAAFNGVSDDGDPAALTAGHCSQGDSGLLEQPLSLLGLPLSDDEDADEEENTEDNQPLGEDEDSTDGSDTFGTFLDGSPKFGDGHDAAILNITNDAWTPQPLVAAPEGENDQGEGLAIYDSIRPIAGAPVCKTGATSGWSCGNVLAAEGTVPVSGEDVSGFMFDACTLPGDDGGPIVVGNYAVGISSGTTWEDAECAETNSDGDPHVAVGYALSGGEHTADELYGDDWNLSIHVGEPQVDAPVEGDVTGEKPTIKGSIDAAAGATVVVTVAGTEPVEATVQPDGTWRAPIDTPLAPGQHSYSVTAAHTASNAEQRMDSGTVTDTFKVAEVANLAVATPTDGETTRSTQPQFAGTGDPGARLTLKFDEETTSTIVDDDGTWSITPREGLRAGRYDAVVTQDAGGTVEDVSINRIGIAPGAPLIAGVTDDVTTGQVIAGTAIPGSTVAVRVQLVASADEDGPDPGDSPGEYISQAGDDGTWEVELSGLEAGAYSVTAVQAVDDLTSERSAAVPFEVSGLTTRGAQEVDADEEDLAETGRSPLVPILVGAALVALGTLGALWRRRARASV